MAASTVRIALSIAGSDPSGGAGIQADLKTFSALGVYGAAVVAALTAQNTRGVRAVHVLPAAFVVAQIEAVYEDLAVRATKLGMLANAETVLAVAACLKRAGAKQIVLDPVMVAKSGARLLDPEAVAALRSELLPLADVVTPNLPEAAVLLDIAEGEVLTSPETACRALHALGPRAVLLKGGHAAGAMSEDLLFDGAEFRRLPARRVATDNTHGTGCTLSAALAAFLAHGEPLQSAAQLAKHYLTEAILAGSEWKIGAGHGPVHHFHAIWPEESRA